MHKISFNLKRIKLKHKLKIHYGKYLDKKILKQLIVKFNSYF